MNPKITVCVKGIITLRFKGTKNKTTKTVFERSGRVSQMEIDMEIARLNERAIKAAHEDGDNFDKLDMFNVRFVLIMTVNGKKTQTTIIPPIDLLKD